MVGPFEPRVQHESERPQHLRQRLIVKRGGDVPARERGVGYDDVNVIPPLQLDDGILKRHIAEHEIARGPTQPVGHIDMLD